MAMAAWIKDPNWLVPTADKTEELLAFLKSFSFKMNQADSDASWELVGQTVSSRLTLKSVANHAFEHMPIFLVIQCGLVDVFAIRGRERRTKIRKLELSTILLHLRQAKGHAYGPLGGLPAPVFRHEVIPASASKADQVKFTWAMQGPYKTCEAIEFVIDISKVVHVWEIDQEGPGDARLALFGLRD